MSLRSLRGIVPIAAVLLIWQLFGSEDSVNTPPPSVWWDSFTEIAESGALWPALTKTLTLFTAGLLVATCVGVVVGGAIGASPRLGRALGPLLEFVRATPAAAIVPAALLLFHASTRTQVAIVAYGCVWPILLNTSASRAALPGLRLDVAHCLQLSTGERMRKVVLPSLLPEIVTGIRIAAPISLIVALLVDFLVATGGIGYLLVQYQQSFQTAGAFALLAVIGVVGIVINILIGSAERLILRRWPVGA